MIDSNYHQADQRTLVHIRHHHHNDQVFVVSVQHLERQEQLGWRKADDNLFCVSGTLTLTRLQQWWVANFILRYLIACFLQLFDEAWLLLWHDLMNGVHIELNDYRHRFQLRTIVPCALIKLRYLFLFDPVFLSRFGVVWIWCLNVAMAKADDCLHQLLLG